MQLTENQQNLAKAYGKRVLNKELYSRGVIPKALYDIAAEKLILEIDRLDKLCMGEAQDYAYLREGRGSYNEPVLHNKAV